MTAVTDVGRYLAALREGYEVLAHAMDRAAALGAKVPARLHNEVEMGHAQARELSREFARDPETLLSAPYAPLTEAAIASQSRALAWVEMAYRELVPTAGDDPHSNDEVTHAIGAAADATAHLSSQWAELWQLVGQAAAQPVTAAPLPREVTLGGSTIVLRRVEQADGPLIIQFARSLPGHDLLFLRRDITEPEQVDAWLRDAAAGISDTVLAVRGGELVGYATTVSDGLHWTRHLRELRVVVAPAMRGLGLGRLLTEQAFAIARQQGVKKMMAQMTTDQETAIAVFSRMGFEREAVLHNHVMDRDGSLHDLQIMSLDVDAFRAKVIAAVTEP